MDKGNGLREGTPPCVFRWRRACGPPGVVWLVVNLCFDGRFRPCSFLLLQELSKEGVIELVSPATGADEEPSVG